MGKGQTWRKLHISVDPDSHEITTHALTDDDTSDSAMIADLVAGSGGNIRSIVSFAAALCLIKFVHTAYRLAAGVGFIC